ncbi:hypothetical protein EW145_g2353 [Phellinidium pouzarii]|uniref:Cytochrome P450 n=1 Tax=Phellinidium pouzarii TaxID=167371 RepID=A0A4S4LB60_9AGAM|nr:hypothetical protein EW145_g2353 [Phellinidium pouzarii]
MDFSTPRADAQHIAVFLVAGLGVLFLMVRLSSVSLRAKQHGLSLPPGPKALPFIGNLLNMRMKQPWETITKWGKQYGDVVHVEVLGQSIIFLNSAKATSDLFEKRSTIYSDRPRLPLLNDILGLNWIFALMPYGNIWRKHRRLFVSMFGPSDAHIFNPVQEHASTRLLERLLKKPEDFRDHIRLLFTIASSSHSGQSILMSAYGLDVDSCDNHYITVAEEVMSIVADAARPGRWLVDSIPMLKKIPAYFPGAFEHQKVKHFLKNIRDLRETSYADSKEMLANGKSPMQSFVSELLEKHGHAKEEMEGAIRDCAAIAYGAGSDTSVGALAAFVLAMAQYPGVQKKAQDQLDTFVGSSRLPSFSDRKNLPYITAIMKETLRWHTVVPQGLPHCLREDDIYNGYFMPAGSIVIGNSWGILHDPDIYPDPMEFKPERFFNSEGELDYAAIDPSKYGVFGYGRRYCAGYTYAENNLFLAITYILSTLDIGLAKDVYGRPVPVALRPTFSILSRLPYSHPSSFKCSITPRSEQTKALIIQANSF